MNARVSHSANRRLRRPPDAAPTAPPIRALAVAATDDGRQAAEPSAGHQSA
jgi:hypothetical protein